MPKTSLLKLTCDFCSNYVTFDPEIPDEKLTEMGSAWKGVVNLLQNPVPQGVDPHRWYDTLECMSLGEKRHEEQKREAIESQKKQEEILAKANAQLKQSAYMTDRSVTVGKA